MAISLKAARIDKGLRQIDLAKAVGVSRETVQAWEKGTSKPRTDKIDIICEVLGRSYDEIRWR